jgi:hypothetical protein
MRDIVGTGITTLSVFDDYRCFSGTLGGMWRMRSHLLAPLSALVSPKVKFKWCQEHQDAFDQIKTLISKETLLTFPNFNEPFHIYTDASKYQLGAVILQNNKP